MNPDYARISAVRAAVARYGAMDPSAWDTGLSPEGARAALRVATQLVLAGDLRPRRGIPPEELLIWCAANVFTAPLEWTALFAAWGSRVTLKAPSACPAPVLALAQAFEGLGAQAVDLPHEQAWPLLQRCDAVLGFGGDDAMAELSRRLHPQQRRSLHGHKLSLVVVQGSGPALAQALAEDAALYDGRGCLSPTAVFTLGDAEALCEQLALAMQDLARRWPRGALSPAEGVAWRSRVARARVQGRAWVASDWAVTLAPAHTFHPIAPPRLLPVHPVQSLDELPPLLSGLPLSTVCTDLDPAQLQALPGFWRSCRPGQMQRPPLGRDHDGLPVLDSLCMLRAADP